jgi:PKD repeat protein
LVRNEGPTAPITGLPASGRSPEGKPIVLSANSAADPNSTNPANFTYAWTVTESGNVYASGSGTNFSFTPEDDGTYVIRLKAKDQAGRTGVTTQTLQVTKVAPTVTLNGPSRGDVKQDLTFQANVSDPSSVNMAAGFHYYWHFGDGSGSTGRTVTHAYKARGTYAVTLTVWDVDGVGTRVTKTITVG